MGILARDFARLVNMTPAQIRRWRHDPRAKCASQYATIARLDQLARLKAKPPARWTTADIAYARKVVGFVKRHKAQEATCSPLRTIALRNWGHASKCAVPSVCRRPVRVR